MSSKSHQAEHLSAVDSGPPLNGQAAKPLFDSANLYSGALNMLQAPDVRRAMKASCQFLLQGLAAGERVAVATFEHPETLFSGSGNERHLLDAALRDERLIYLYYKPELSQRLGLSHDYLALCNEVLNLCNGRVDRLALLNAEALLNLHSEPLIYGSLQQLTWMAAKFPGTVLGVYAAGDGPLTRLDAACHSSVPNYIRLDSE